MRQTIDGCQLEIDGERGVLYVHGPNGVTLLRLGGLPRPVPEVVQDIDMRIRQSQTVMLDVNITPSGHGNPYPKVLFSWQGLPHPYPVAP
jgi:hypothetical protein